MYYNLVYVKFHEDDKKNYIFSLPLDKKVCKRDTLIVKDRCGGEAKVTAVTGSFILISSIAENVVIGSGGFFPPASVLKTVRTEEKTISVEYAVDFETGEEEVTADLTSLNADGVQFSTEVEDGLPY